MIGLRRGAPRRQTKGSADVLDGRLQLFDGKLAVAIGVEFLKLVIHEAAENFLVLNQLHYT